MCVLVVPIQVLSMTMCVHWKRLLPAGSFELAPTPLPKLQILVDSMGETEYPSSTSKTTPT